jgi:hypothetical protein
VLCAPLRLERSSLCDLPHPLLLGDPKRRFAFSSQPSLLALTSCTRSQFSLPRRLRLGLSRCGCGLRLCLPTLRFSLALLS